MSKVRYKLRNWSQYNQSLINRGDMTIWFSQESTRKWYSQKRTGKKGHPQKYTDSCIELILTVKNLFRLPLRGVQGYFRGLMKLMGMCLEIPDYTRLSRRAAELEIEMKKTGKKKGHIDVVLDSTGLKIYGEGEWKTRTHGKSKRRTWRKLHIGIDPKTGEIVATDITKAEAADCKSVKCLLSGLTGVDKVYADGAYMFKCSMDPIAAIGAKPVIPVATGTWLVEKNPSPGEKLRNEIVLETTRAGGKAAWKKSSGYHLRSLVETHMYRHKTILGDRLSSRKFENQKTEGKIKCSILNKMTALGMPESYKI